MNNDLGIWLDVFDTLLKTELNAANHQHIGAAEVGHFVIFAQQGRQCARKKITFEFTESDRSNIGAFSCCIDQCEFGIREFLRNLGNGCRVFRAKPNDQLIAILCGFADVFTLRILLVIESFHLHAEFLHGFLQAFIGTIVECFITKSATRKHERDLGLGTAAPSQYSYCQRHNEQERCEKN